MIRDRKTLSLLALLTVSLSVLCGVPTANAKVPATTNSEVSGMPQVNGINNQVFLPLTSKPPEHDWPMLAANPQRTSWTPEEVRGNLSVVWYRPIEPYIPYKVQPIAANGKIYVSTSKGLYAFSALNGNVDWVYPTELPLGHSPTIATVNEKSIAFVGGYDHKIHAIDALTGLDVAGYTPYEAQAGFETNPLVINNTIYAGNRDGYFYAFDAITGAKLWSFETDGPILFSAAYKDNTLYFASNDSYAYALNATNGSLVWKSQKFPGAGFHSFWPVIYTEKASGKTYVIYGGSENYRFGDTTNVSPWANLLQIDQQSLLACWPSNCTAGLAWPTSLETGPTTYWGHDAVTLNASAITNYFENSPSLHTTFVLNSSTGQEYTFDANGNGKPEYAPFTWSGVTSSGNKYPAIINGIDDVMYQDTLYYALNWIARGDIVGWKFGTPIVSRVSPRPDAHAVDEPMAFSSGGKLIYWSLCCDREGGAFDVTIPYGQSNRSWQTYGYNFTSLFPNYDPMYNDGNATLFNDGNGWQVYSGKNQSKNGVYGKHGTTQSPPIPYQGKLFMLRGNTLLAFGPGSTTPSRLPLAPITVAQSAFPSPSVDELQQRLSAEIQKMLVAGHLRPGYFSSGFLDLYADGKYSDSREIGELLDYFQNPSDTVVTLIQALPYLSPSMQQQVKTYLQTYYGPGSTYDLTKIAHIGWATGAARENYDIPQSDWSIFGTPYRSPLNPSTKPICGGCGYWTSFPPYSFYAAWKYAQVFGGAQTIFSQMSGKLNVPPADNYLLEKPYILNLYISGYQGYLQLQQLAGYSPSPTIQMTYTHLLTLRTTNFSKDTPYLGGIVASLTTYNNALAVARNFMFLTPELGAYLNQNIKAQVQNAVDEYQYVAPYWFVTGFDNSYGEGTFQMLYDSPALFQAKAYILKQPYNELVKYLDVPTFFRGDLFYIQNLTAALGVNATP